MKNTYWTIIDPKGKVWMDCWWKSRHGVNGAWEFLHWSEEKSVKELKQEGYKVTQCYVEIQEVP